MQKRFKTRKKKAMPARRRKKSKLLSWRGVLGLGVLVILLSAGYLSQVSSVSSKSYEFRVLEKEIAGLKDQQEKLELQVAARRSMNVVDGKVVEMGMVPADNVEYLSTTAAVVARR